MPERIKEHRSVPLLGKSSRAEKLVKWSSQVEAGRRSTREFVYGLRLELVANGSSPQVEIYWNNKRFDSFVKNLGFSPEKLFFLDFGFSVSLTGNRINVSLPAIGRGKLNLWDSADPFCAENETEAVNWLLGMLELSPEGPLLYSRREAQGRRQTFAPQTQARVQKTTPKTRPTKPGAVLTPEQLPQKTRNFLLQDAVLNALLKEKRSSEGEG